MRRTGVKHSAYALSNAVARENLAAGNPKYHAGETPLEQEAALKVIEPTSEQQLKELMKMIDLMYAEAGPQQRKALDFYKGQMAVDGATNAVKMRFLRRFYFWLLGRGTNDDHAKTLWGRGNVAVYNAEVAAYIEQFVEKRLQYALQLSLLAQRIPVSLNGFYLYFKYIVNGELRRAKGNDNIEFWDLSNDDFLKDFEVLAQYFDMGNNGKHGYADLIEPAANRPENAAPFGAKGTPFAGVRGSTEPYPAGHENDGEVPGDEDDENKMHLENNRNFLAKAASGIAKTYGFDGSDRREPPPETPAVPKQKQQAQEDDADVSPMEAGYEGEEAGDFINEFLRAENLAPEHLAAAEAGLEETRKKNERIFKSKEPGVSKAEKQAKYQAAQAKLARDAKTTANRVKIDEERKKRNPTAETERVVREAHSVREGVNRVAAGGGNVGPAASDINEKAHKSVKDMTDELKKSKAGKTVQGVKARRAAAQFAARSKVETAANFQKAASMPAAQRSSVFTAAANAAMDDADSTEDEFVHAAGKKNARNDAKRTARHAKREAEATEAVQQAPEALKTFAKEALQPKTPARDVAKEQAKQAMQFAREARIAEQQAAYEAELKKSAAEAAARVAAEDTARISREAAVAKETADRAEKDSREASKKSDKKIEREEWVDADEDQKLLDEVAKIRKQFEAEIAAETAEKDKQRREEENKRTEPEAGKQSPDRERKKAATQTIDPKDLQRQQEEAFLAGEEDARDKGVVGAQLDQQNAILRANRREQKQREWEEAHLADSAGKASADLYLQKQASGMPREQMMTELVGNKAKKGYTRQDASDYLDRIEEVIRRRHGAN